MLLALLTSAGWEPRVLRRDVWGADRFSAVGGDRVRLACRARGRVRAPDGAGADHPAPGRRGDPLPGPRRHAPPRAAVEAAPRTGRVRSAALAARHRRVGPRHGGCGVAEGARCSATVDRTAFALADLVVVDTPEVGAFYAERFGLRADKALVVWPGTDTDRLGPPADDDETRAAGPVPRQLHPVARRRDDRAGRGPPRRHRPAVPRRRRRAAAARGGGADPRARWRAEPHARGPHVARGHRRRDPGRVALPRHLRHHAQGRPGRAVQGVRVHGAAAARSSPATRRPPATPSATTWCSSRRATRPRSPPRSAP